MKRLAIEVDKNNLHEDKQKLEREVAKLREDRKLLVNLKEELKKQELITAQFMERKIEMERALIQQQSLYDTQLAVFNMTLQTIPEDVRVLAKLQERIAETEKKKEELDHAWETVQKVREETSEKLTAAKSAEIHAGETLGRSRREEEPCGKQIQKSIGRIRVPDRRGLSRGENERSGPQFVKRKSCSIQTAAP